MLTRGKIMKRILLTSTALVAFAGAAAADVSLSGSASFSYNNNAGTVTNTSTTSLTATASQALNNGYTASASLTAESKDGAEVGLKGGNVSIASDSASITYHMGGTGVGAAYIGTGASDMMTDNNITFGKDGDDQVNKTADVSATASLGGATIRASLDGTSFQLGVSTDLGGSTLDAGFDQNGNVFGVQLGGETSGVSYTLGFDSANSYGLNASTTAGGADVTLDFGDLGWKIGASMPLGAATVGVSMTDTNAAAGTGWEATAKTSLESVDLGITLTQAEGASTTTWKMTADYSADPIGLSFSTTGGSWTVGATYDMGNGLTAGVGTDGTDQYVMVDYDLGAGANLSMDYATGKDVLDQTVNAGTTVGVSFDF
jgi:hypothetical protein